MAGQERRQIDLRLIAVAGLLSIGGKLLCQMAAAAILSEICGSADHLGIGRAINISMCGWRCIFLSGGPAENDNGHDEHQYEKYRDYDFVESAGHSILSGKSRPTLCCANGDAPGANSASTAGISNFTIVISSRRGLLWYRIIAAVEARSAASRIHRWW